MNAVLRFGLVVIFISSSVLAVAARKKPHHAPAPSKADVEAATRLQVFLDRANFSPGKIEGGYNEFTQKALVLYRESRGEQPQTLPQRPNSKSNAMLDVNGLDLASVGTVFVPYTIIDADLQNIGPLPNDVAQRAKLKFLPYRDAASLPRTAQSGQIQSDQARGLTHGAECRAI